MRTGVILAFVVLATAGPAFAAPASSPIFARDAAPPAASTTPSTSAISQPVDESGAISLGSLATIAGVALPAIGSVVNYFTDKSSQQQKRDVLALERLLRRQAQDDSEALSFSTIGNIASIGLDIGKAASDIFSSNSNQQQQQQRRSFTLEDASKLAGIASSIAGAVTPAVQDVWTDLHKSSRRAAEESGAITLDQTSKMASIFSSIASAVTPAAQDIYNDLHKSSRREAEESGALSLDEGAKLAGIASSVAGAVTPIAQDIWTDLHQRSRRDELEALFARAQTEQDESGALSFGTIAKIGSFAVPAVSALIDHFTGGDSNNQQQRRELLGALFARSLNELD